MNLQGMGDNLLAVLIVGGFGYIIYSNMKGKDVLGKFKEKMNKIKGGNNKMETSSSEDITEEQIAALEDELKRLKVEVVLQTLDFHHHHQRRRTAH